MRCPYKSILLLELVLITGINIPHKSVYKKSLDSIFSAVLIFPMYICVLA